VACRVEAVDTSGEKRDRLPVGGEGGPVGHAVDAIRCAADDGEATVDEAAGGFHADVLAVTGRGPCSHQSWSPALQGRCPCPVPTGLRARRGQGQLALRATVRMPG